MADNDVNKVSDRYAAGYWPLNPVEATHAGIAGYHDQLTDYSPDGCEARAELARRTLADLVAATPVATNSVAGPLLKERLELAVEQYEAGEHWRDLNTIACPVQEIRAVFDLMPTSTPDEIATIARRMAAVPAAMDGLQAAYQTGIDHSLTPARRQVEVVASQCHTWAGDHAAQRPAAQRPTAQQNSVGAGFFTQLVDRIEDGETPLSPALLKDLRSGAAAAESAYADMGTWLLTDLLSTATPTDAVGADRYRRFARLFIGAELDLEETYEWGWAELERLDDQKRALAEQIIPGGTLADAVAALDADPARHVKGHDALTAWMQRLSDEAIDALDGTHFDIAEPIRTLECRIAPPGGPLGAYYTPPSDGFSRPGRMWWSTGDDPEQVFHSWQETTTVYHEGVPGHHLQCAQVVHRSDHLNDFQRLLCWIPGHGEGWALYAEELMAELGYLDDPGDRLGMLDAQALRAARVVVDIGLHLDRTTRSNRWGIDPDVRWTPDLARRLMGAATSLPEDHIASEVDRYLGWPAQAISYKVGQRYWQEAREESRRRHGDSFNLKTFHTAALNLGSVGLDVLQSQLSAL